MKHFKSWQKIPSYARNSAVAIGNFDGVHLGHRTVLDTAKRIGNLYKCPTAVLTFEPHPRQFFAPKERDFRLMSAVTKAHRIEKNNIDYYFEITFTHEIAGLSAQEFVQKMLVERLGISHAIVGENFHFGKGREGNVEMLKHLGGIYDFEVTEVTSKKLDEKEVSSSLIRKMLTEAKPKEAASMLGHWHRIEGAVIDGEKRGHLLGFPTANIALDGLHLPHFGVYSVLVDVLNGVHKGQYKGVASLGKRPMFAGQKPNLETYIFDFSGDIYGADLSVALVEFLRPEAVFPSITELQVQMQSDCNNARQLLEKGL